MNRPRPVLLAALLSLAACGVGETARSCRLDADCGAEGEAFCDRGTCVANGAPSVMVLAPQGPLLSHALHAFAADATDPEGEAVRVAWSVVAVAGGCPGDADAVGGTSFGAEIAFWCPGTYDVVAAAADPWGHEGTGRARVSVVQAEGAPTVSAGPDLAADHRCQGEPLVCQAIGAGASTSFPLSASGASPGGGVLEYAWRAFPPPGADGAVAAFAPGPTGAAPSVSLQSPGTAIAGPWSMRVRVRNEQGLLAQDVQVVNVGNRPPALAAPAGFSGPHRYEDGSYVADVDLLVDAVDPDGDPVAATFALSATAGNGCSHGLAPTGPTSSRLTLSCAEPTELIGGVAWTVAATVTDVNGATDTGPVPLQILNSPPSFALEGGAPIPAHAAVAHAFEACTQAGGQCFRTRGEPGLVARDPDGDPLEWSAAAAVEVSRAHSRGSASVGADGVARFAFETDQAYPAEFRAVDGTGGFSVVASALDPFGAAASLSLPVRVGNGAPVVEIAQPVVAVDHRYDRSSSRYRVPSVPVARISDPDGDPVLGGGVGDGACTLTGGDGIVEVGCELLYQAIGTTAPPLGSLAGDHLLEAMARDAWETAWAPVTLRVTNQAAVPDAPYTVALSSDRCACTCMEWDDLKPVCRLWELVPPLLEVPLRFTEPEDDPVLADGFVCLAGACTVRRTEGTHAIAVSDGVASATVQFTLTVDCSPSGSCP
ncbi:MAG TPA: hypothetical protein VLS93_13590 [Anaeromyxobacteraceae bacterium]|nr:hypothetical protein [Anaeromyxobacteraceae bacterium]